MFKDLFSSAKDVLQSASTLVDRAKATFPELSDADEGFFTTQIAPHLARWALEMSREGNLEQALGNGFAHIANGEGIPGPCGPILATRLEWCAVPGTRAWGMALHADLMSAAGAIHRVARWEVSWEDLPDPIRAASIRQGLKQGRVDFITLTTPTSPKEA